MISEAFAALKAPRQMTLQHWRFRLLHFTFGINPSTAEDSKLPGFLYTHYCPLFHVTNAMLLALPLTLCLRLVISLTRGGLRLFVRAVRATFGWVLDTFGPATPAKIVTTPEEIRAFELARIKKWLQNTERFRDDFEYLYESMQANGFEHVSRDEAYALWSQLREQYQAAADAELASLRKRQAYMATLVNCSRWFVKAVIQLGVVLVLGAVFYGLFWAAPWIGQQLHGLWAWLQSGGWSEVLQGMGIGLLIVIAIAACLATWGYIYYKFGPFEMDFATPVKKAPTKFGRRLRGLWTGLADFVSMYYEDNCPPIELVDETPG
jgi:hypothetical protein